VRLSLSTIARDLQADIGEPQYERAHQHHHDQEAGADHLVQIDRRGDDVEHPQRLRRQAGRLRDGQVAEQQDRHRWQRHRQPHRRDDLDQRGALPQMPEQAQVAHGAQERAEQHQRQDRGGRDRPAVLGV
jgi:hypothetical protein